jgi:hypothetical protein
MVTVQLTVLASFAPTDANSVIIIPPVVGESTSEASAVHTTVSPVSPSELTVIVKWKTSFPVTVVDAARISSTLDPACGSGLKLPVFGSKIPGIPDRSAAVVL